MAKREGRDAGVKTNAMRILDKNKVPYEVISYQCEEFIDGVHIADQLGQPYEISFKTLAAVGRTGNYYVFVLPVDREVDLKKAARCVGEKSVELLHVKDINRVTGYIRGGCTPIGMKKLYPTFIHESAEALDKIFVSGGQLGTHIYLSPADLARVVNAQFADIVADNDLEG